MARSFARLATLLVSVLIVLVSGTSIALAGAKPPEPYPDKLKHAQVVGINKKTGEYCDLYGGSEKDQLNCRPPMDCEDYPANTVACVGEGSSDPEDAHRFELKELARWEKKADKNAPNYAKTHAYLKKCVEKDKKPFSECRNEAASKYPPPAKTPLTWVSGKISEMAANALEEAASMLGHSVVWLLKQFADAFNSISTIDLTKTGIGPMLGITTGLSLVVATFMLLVQFGKLAVSQQGGPLATAAVGLAKYGVILGVYLFGTQVALNWSDTLSTALINYTFESGSPGGDASEAMEKQLGTLFAGLVGTGGASAAGTALITGSGIAPTSVGFVIVISILCLLAIGALWIEMLIRQAGIMILLVMTPIALAGSMSDSTKDWWPKTRNALIALILMKPVIVLCFSIGFSTMSGGEGVRNVIVGLIIFVVAGVSWPVLAKFIVLTPNGEGASGASGMISSVGNSMSSLFGGNQPSPSGAGTTGGGGAYTKALESENSSGSGGGGGSFWSKAVNGSKGGSFMGKAGGVVGLGLQLAAVGKDITEAGFTNAAAHAGLGPGTPGGRHAVIGPRGSAEPAAQATQETEPPEPPPPNPEPTPTTPTPTGTPPNSPKA
uniref:TrbL/VirB6 plasmid conjugal transfer protein n=1 Tax=Streptomyces sp. 14R-10 TaxID=1442159 RepID=W0FTK4_9ACTN|nr:conjugal transfer protein TrbL [Streptomyces sp. 14R-10]AHF46203.1 TrbL/VirB6 plasmid conjugal transfer protein [Streptomyces sp. 14R-10]